MPGRALVDREDHGAEATRNGASANGHPRKQAGTGRSRSRPASIGIRDTATALGQGTEAVPAAPPATGMSAGSAGIQGTGAPAARPPTWVQSPAPDFRQRGEGMDGRSLVSGGARGYGDAPASSQSKGASHMDRSHRARAAGLTLATAIAALACAAPAHALQRGAIDVRRPAASAVVPASVAAARRDERARGGRLGVLAVSPSTGGVRMLGRLDGLLTAASSRPAADVALDYVRARPAVFGLDAADLSGLQLVRHYRAGGIEQLRWAQSYRGITAIDSSLTANLTASGRLVNVLGEPRHDLALDSIDAARRRRRGLRRGRARGRRQGRERAPGVGRRRARDELRRRRRGAPRHLRARRPAPGLAAARAGRSRPRLRRRRRRELGARAARAQHRRVGGRRARVPQLPRRGRAGRHAADGRPHRLPRTPARRRCSGPTRTRSPTPTTSCARPATTRPPAGEVVPGVYDINDPNSPDCMPLLCIWKPGVASSWAVNRQADATQLHWFVSNFHDYLRDTPEIAFDDAAGAFDGDDPLLAQSMDGANTDAGLPDDDHVDNANMATLPRRDVAADADVPHRPAGPARREHRVRRERRLPRVHARLRRAHDHRRGAASARSAARRAARSTRAWRTSTRSTTSSTRALETDAAGVPDVTLGAFAFGAAGRAASRPTAPSPPTRAMRSRLRRRHGAGLRRLHVRRLRHDRRRARGPRRRRDLDADDVAAAPAR